MGCSTLFDEDQLDSDLRAELNSLNGRGIGDKSLHKNAIKNYYDKKGWWSIFINLCLLGIFICVISLISYYIYISEKTCSTTVHNVTNTGSGIYLPNLSLSPGLYVSLNIPEFRIYNQAATYINNSDIDYGLRQALTIQLQRDVAPLWDESGIVTFNATNNYSPVSDGSWPIFFINVDLGMGLGFHTVAVEPQFNPSFTAGIAIGTPYAVIELPTICDSSMSYWGCVAKISEVCSHEILETLIDPNVNSAIVWETVATNTQTLPDELVVYAEIADSVQGQLYIINSTYAHFPVQNFVTPQWFSQLSNADPSVSIVFDFLQLLTQPGQVSPDGYIPYSNMTNGCYINYLPSSTVYGQHDRVVQSCSYRLCSCIYQEGTILGSDPIGFSFANVYGSAKQDMLIRAILDSHI
jgi:hypothetical protein